jgi:hypothetical protein
MIPTLQQFMTDQDQIFVSYNILPEKGIISVNLKVAIREVRRFPHSTMRYRGQSP